MSKVSEIIEYSQSRSQGVSDPLASVFPALEYTLFKQEWKNQSKSQ